MNSTYRRTALGLIPVSGALLALLLLGAAPANASGSDDSSSGSGSSSSSSSDDNGSQGGHGSDDGAGHDVNDDVNDDHGASSGHDSASDINDDHGANSGHDSASDANDDNRDPSANSGRGSADGTTTVYRRHGKTPRVIARQQCGVIDTKLKLKADNGGTEVEYELDQNVNGVAWTLKLTRNGTSVATASRTTHAPSGSFGWHVLTTNPAGADAYTVTAVNGTTTCTIAATL